MDNIDRQAEENRRFPNPSHYPPGVSGNPIGYAKRGSGEAGQIQMLRGAVVSLIRCGGAQFAKDILALKPKDRVATILSLLRLVLPKVKPVNVAPDTEADAAESVSDLLRAVYARQDSAIDDDAGSNPGTTDGLLRHVRRQVSREDEDFDEDED